MNIQNILDNTTVRLRTWSDKAAIRVLVVLHLAIASFGVIGLFFIFRIAFENRYAADVDRKSEEAVKYFEWLRPYYFPDHKYTLYAYVGACVLLGLLAFVAFLVQAKGIGEGRVDRRLFPWIYKVDLVLVVIMLALSTKQATTGLIVATTSFLAWVCVVTAPFVLSVTQTNWAARWIAIIGLPKVLSLPKLLITIFALQFLLFIFPFLNGSAIFYNEYFEIPSETWISTGALARSKLVDNLNYINANRLWGNHLRYDPRVNPGEDPPCLPGARINLPKTDRLRDFVDEHKDRYYLRYPSGELCFTGPMEDVDKDILQFDFPDQQQQIANVYLQSQAIFAAWYVHNLPPEQVDFVEHNLTEITQSIHGLEAIFHHHFQFLNPIKELTEGRSKREIVALYGNNFIPLTSLMQWSGGVTYTAFLAVIFSIYIIYLASVLAVTSYIFRDLRYVAIIFLSSVGLVNALGYITIFVGLGYSPIRHFLDIFVVLSLFQYLNSKRTLWLAGTVVLASLSVCLDRFFGSFVFIALLVLLAIRLICGHAYSKRDEAAAIIVSVPTFIALFVISGQVVAASPYTEGFLDGVWGFPVSNVQMALFLMGFVFGYIWLAYLMSRHFDQRHYLTLFLLLYVQLLLVYWITVPNYGHLYAVLPMAIFAGVSLLRFGIAPLMPRIIERPVVAGVLGMAVLVSLWGSHNFNITRGSMESVEKNHRIYDWDFSNMKIRSTMTPEPFANSIRLIQKYAPQRKGIYILSQFDTVLTWLSDNYSLMPFFDLGSFLNSPTSERKAVERLTAGKPAILFVDTCIKCSPEILRLGRTLPGLEPAYTDRIREKIDRLRHLRDVFSAIENDYELVEKGMLISVYRRK